MLGSDAKLATGKPAAPGAATSSDDAIVRIRGLEKSFAKRRSVGEVLRYPFARTRVPVLRGVDLDVPRGGFFGLLGENGAGKTTLFKILATLVAPDAGEVFVDGIALAEHPERVRQRLTPVIADERSLDWRLTARQNLSMYAALYGLSSRDGRERTNRLLEVVGLVAAADRMVGTYSSGMKQRLLIARAILSRPAVLLLDEPTRSLDPISARSFRAFLRDEVAGRQGCSVVLATHDAEEAFELCDRLAVLHGGRIVAAGSAEVLWEKAGEGRFRVAVPQARQADALRRLADVSAEGFAPAAAPPVDGWGFIEGELAPDPERAASVVQALVGAGIPVSQAMRVSLPLADVIERVSSRQDEVSPEEAPAEGGTRMLADDRLRGSS
jgi:ABC-2 type transport system ATP-binding protein